jgi:TetR/AcrR family fatty acid metabolism transcriptional regulator
METRQRLLDAATVEFAVNGFVGANINSISTKAGFSKGTIYNHFSNKRDLMLNLIDAVAAKHTDFIIAQVQEEEDPVLRLKQFFSAGFQFVEQYPHHIQIPISVVYGHDHEFKARFYQAYDGLLVFIMEDVIQSGIVQGVFKQVDADTTTALLMSLYLGNLSQQDPDGKIWFNPDEVVEFVMQGIQSVDGESRKQE